MGKKEYLIQGLKKFFMKASKDFHINRIILFGSRSTNKSKKESDVDLIIVSNDFKGKNFMERASKMYDYWEIDLPVDFLCYTSEEFNVLKKKISIVKEAVKNGIVIK